ncbi:MAG: hydantoinase B/oxoprolinase family protein, partial [Chloroflexi bacterium]|nr:hydantoinase B/oxoprolinase family protein [Chloroflexota bacterium]
FIVKHWVNEPSVGVKEGDSFFFNDPFYCGVHGADMGLAVPVFYKGKLICFTGAIVHTGENGSREPGGMPLSAMSKYDEGLLVPPIKIGENHTLREDILTMFAAMVRDPRTLILDIKARLAACRIAQRRILELVEKKGVDFYIGGLRKIMVDSAEAARRKVAQLPDGVFRQPRFMDTVGTEAALTKVAIRLEKKGDTIKLSFKDTSPMIPDKPLNTFFQGIIGLSMVYFCGWFFYDLPANNALLEVLEWEFPDNTIVKAAGDVPTSLSPFPETAFAHGMFLVGARMSYTADPLRAVASWYNGFNVPYFGGINQWGEPVADILPEINATGCGARPDMDGVDGAGSYFATMSDTGDVEATEADKPFMYLFRNYFPNHGYGKYRGGSGVGFGIVVHHVPWLFKGCFGYGTMLSSTMGIFGGYASTPSVLQTIRQPNLKQLLAESSPAIPTNLLELYTNKPLAGYSELTHVTRLGAPYVNGDIMFVPVGGGSGFGDVLERDPALVVEDLRLGLTTHWVARNVYKVGYDEKTLRIDQEATRKAREEERANRLRLGVSFDEFEKEWSKKRPPQEILKYYGAYPNPSEGPTGGPPAIDQ